MAKLTVKGIERLRESGRYADGQVSGLYLNMARTGSKSFVQRIVVDGKRKDVGLGGFPTVSLATAREWATDNRSLVARGKHHSPRKRDGKPLRVSLYPNGTLRRSETLLARRMSKLGDVPIDKVSKFDLRDLLAGILSTTPETGKSVRGMLAMIFDHAVWLELIASNPVRDIPRDQLPDTPPQKHMRRLPYACVSGALDTIDKSDASLVNKLAIRLLALTAVRSQSVRLATWDQFDLDAGIWTIPEISMKSREQFRVPLSRQALDVLEVARTLNPDSELVFPNEQNMSKPYSDSAYSKLFRELQIPATPHGLRTSFREWADEVQQADFAVAETALAHVVGSKVTRAYLRGDYLNERRELMQAWANYLDADGMVCHSDSVFAC